MHLRRNVLNINEKKDNGSKFVFTMIVLYMASILLFTASVVLNVISQMIFVVAFGTCTLYMLFKGKNFRIDTFIIVFASFIAFCTLGMIWSVDREQSLTSVITMIQLLIMSVIFYSYVSAYENIDLFVWGLMISGLICTYVVIGYYGLTDFINLMIKGERLGGMINNVNAISFCLAVTVIIAFYEAYLNNKKYCYIIMVFPFVAAFGTGSRTGLAMMAVGISIIIYIKYRKKITAASFVKFLIMVLAFVLIIRWLSTLPIFESTFERFSNMLSDSNNRDNSSSVRFKMMEIGWNEFLKRPLTGVGIKNSFYLMYQYFGTGGYLHNNFFELLACVGIFGFLIFYSIHFYLIKNLYILSIREENNCATVMLAIIVAMFVADFGTVSYYDKMTYVYFVLAAATVAVAKRKIYAEKLEKEYEEIEKEQAKEFDKLEKAQIKIRERNGENL